MAGDNNYAIYQNHPLDSFINVSVHYVTLSSDGSSMQSSDENSCNATLYSVRDITCQKKWYVCEIHMEDQKIHGTMTVFNRISAYEAPTKKELTTAIQDFIKAVKEDQQTLAT